MHFAELGAVTIDGYGTLLRLEDPIRALGEALAAHGVERNSPEIEAAFRAEAGYYRPRSYLGRDEPSLARLRLECVGVFLDALGSPLDPADFVGSFIDALVFEPIAGAEAMLQELRGRGLPLAVVANWDCALPGHLDRAGLSRYFETVVTSARAVAAKPDPSIFSLALTELGAVPERAVHVGDEPLDEAGARAAGLRFLPAPLSTAFEGWS